MRQFLAGLVIFSFVPAIAQETATFSGVVTDTSGNAVGAGYTVKLTDVVSGGDFKGVTDADCSYKIQVPAGGRYRLESVLADDGETVLPVQKVPPIAPLVASNNRLDVRFTLAAPPMAVAAAVTESPSTPTPPAAEEEKKKSSAPWYKRPGPIIGMVAGAGGVLAIALSGGDADEQPVASPSEPRQ